MLPRSGISKPEQRDADDQQDVHQPDQRVRQKLADDELRAAERRDVQLFQRAELLLPDDAHRGQVRRHHQKQQRDNARDHEVAALEARVEPDADSRLDARSRSEPPRPSNPEPAPVRRRQSDSSRSRAQRSRSSRRCRRQSPEPPAAAPLQLARVAGRNRQRHRRLSVFEVAVDFVEAGDQTRRR